MTKPWISKPFSKKSKSSNQKNITVNEAGFEENLSKCKAIEYKFDKIDTILKNMESAKSDLEKAVDNKDEARISASVDSYYKELKKNLESINQELKTMENNLDAEIDNLDLKETEIIHTKLAAYYFELKNKLTKAHTSYNLFRNKAKNRLAKQVQNIDIKNEYNEEQLDRIIDEDPEILQKMVKQQVFGKASMKLQYAAQDILDKCEGIKTLQRNIKELMTMLEQISQIVSLQGEQINSIASHCESAKGHMETGVKHLTEAKKKAQCLLFVSFF